MGGAVRWEGQGRGSMVEGAVGQEGGVGQGDAVGWEGQYGGSGSRAGRGSRVGVASFPGSPSFRTIIPRMTFDPPEGKAEGEPGRFYHMTSVMLRHPYVRYRQGRTRPRLCLCTLCIVGIAESKNLCVDCGSPSVRVRSSNG